MGIFGKITGVSKCIHNWILGRETVSKNSLHIKPYVYISVVNLDFFFFFKYIMFVLNSDVKSPEL